MLQRNKGSTSWPSFIPELTPTVSIQSAHPPSHVCAVGSALVVSAGEGQELSVGILSSGEDNHCQLQLFREDPEFLLAPRPQTGPVSFCKFSA